ncbi:Protein kinase-like domain protein [Ophiocordyceps camponoti-floridani]|uniref:Protein kinase-like domain protein n=1 Tax=Ophiocordyceps camponoti-floridani TaxID=2030778 RepID=A0A8H4Q1Z1_9HYPO|nr:Protein kinase-like domain protein [Ophiocordyceps camponoti-floridani]
MRQPGATVDLLYVRRQSDVSLKSQEREEADRRTQATEQRVAQLSKEREEAEQRAAKESKVRQEAERCAKTKQRVAKLSKEREEAERRAEEAETQSKLAAFQTQSTTLHEYMEACHFHISSRLTVETREHMTTTGFTNPQGKWCPTRLSPWVDFLELQTLTLGTLYNNFPVEDRLFASRNGVVEVGKNIRKPIGDEASAAFFIHLSLENPILTIFDQLKRTGTVRDAFDLGRGIQFDNFPHALSEKSPEVHHQLEAMWPSTPERPVTPEYRKDLKNFKPDQICVYLSRGDERREMLFVCEYKPPHKLTTLHLRAGLRSMDLYREVVNRQTVGTDKEGRFEHEAEKLTASAVTQTYHYMMEAGLEYGILQTGQAMVFLKVDWNDPETVFYHLAEPGPEVLAHPNEADVCSHLGQYLAFVLMALGRPGQRRLHGQDERETAHDRLKTWTVDFNNTWLSMKDSKLKPADQSAYQPVTYKGVNRSPFLLRRRQQPADDEPREPTRRDSPDSDDDGPQPPDTPSPANRVSAPRRSLRLQAHRSQAQGGQQRGGQQGQQRGGQQYCSTRCLAGLVSGGFLDGACPNVHLHRRGSSRRHVSHKLWLRLLWKQLAKSLDDGITPLGQGGARGVLFRITLLGLGYTFVAKGTIRVFVPHLEHEGRVYERLRHVQGVHVPVFLGTMDLDSMDKTYYFDHRVYIKYLMFLSFGGITLQEATTHSNRCSLETKALRALDAIHRLGVVHTDARLCNMLVHPVTAEVMVIDFERAELLELGWRRPLEESTPNKRVRVAAEDKESLSVCRADVRVAEGGFAGKIRELEGRRW